MSSSSRSGQRRDSSRSTSSRRPKLLRSCATEPSVSTSTASRNALANPQSSRRATDLLNQVAFTSGSPPNYAYQYQSASSSPLSQSPSSVYEGMEGMDHRMSSSQHHHHRTHYQDSGRPHLGDSGRYFSFPSFDAFEPEEKEPELKSP